LRADVPAAPYNTLEMLFDDPHLRDAGLFQEREHPTEGTILEIQPANSMSAGMRKDWLPAPRLGQHTEEILAEIGYGDDAIERLIEEGAAHGCPAAEPS
jgi:crotonobetainyl-CoA:carnitine CoA-transferase CaiB-like acyl-CoA transferase